MHAGQVPLHYTPSSVGALMDPAFLRVAVLDAGGEPHASFSAWPPMPPRLRAAWRAIQSTLARLRRH